jgi:predicted DCC family thiol-disulfide oxidoreductase YuxK
MTNASQPSNKQYIVFYDQDCGFCQKWIIFFLKMDKKERLLFAPLNGETAQVELKEWLKTHSTVDSLVFVEKDLKTSDKKIYYYSRAAFRIFWHLGGLWKILGIFSFFPDWMLIPSDYSYRFIAKRRRALFCSPAEMQLLKQFKNRILP